MDNTIIQQGRFTSDGNSEILTIRSDTDWMHVINYTIADANQTTAVGVEYYWQRGMVTDTGIEYKKSNAANAANLTDAMASGGFTLLPEGPSAIVTGTTITKADPPVCTATAHGFSNGDFVALTALTEMPQIASTGFTIGNVATNTFELTHFDTNTANFTQESAFSVRREPQFSFKPSLNWISAVTTGATTQVQLTSASTPTTYVVGDVMRFTVPVAFGMVELDGLTGEVLSLNATTNTYTVAIDSQTFTAFAYPASTAIPTAVPIVTIIGSTSLSPTDAMDNEAFVGMSLAAGVDSPAGVTSDVIYWRAGKSFSVSNS